MYYFLDRVNNNAAYKQLLTDTRDKMFISAFGVQPNEKPFVVSSAEGFALYVCSDYVESQRVLRTLQAVCRGKVAYVPAKEDVLLYKRNASRNSVFARNSSLYAILNGAERAVTCIDALLQYFPERSRFAEDCFTIKKGVCYDTKLLVGKLVRCGFTRVDGISAEGEFVMRGDILDVSLPFGERYRVDFFDDEAEKIRIVNVDGTTARETDKAFVYPLYDTSGLPVEKLAEFNKYIRRLKVSSDAKSRLDEIVSELAAVGGDRVDNAWLIPFVKRSRLFDYLPADTVVFWDEPKRLAERSRFLSNEHRERVANLTKAGEVLPFHEQTLCMQDEAFDADFPQIALQTLPYATDFFRPQVVHSFKTSAVPNYAMNEDALSTDIRNWMRSGYETVILAGADGVKPTQDKLKDKGVYVVEADKLGVKQADGLVLPIGVEHGFVSHTNKLVVIDRKSVV